MSKAPKPENTSSFWKLAPLVISLIFGSNSATSQAEIIKNRAEVGESTHTRVISTAEEIRDRARKVLG